MTDPRMADAGSVIRQPAFAKLNLSLAVGPRRADGYHELRSLMAPLDLHDEIAVRAGRAGGGVSLTLAGPTASGTPADRTNLVCRAAELLADAAGRSADVCIALDKHIPVAGGLAGGSADAAATLLALDKLWGLGYGVERLLPLAARLGSDVPFCLVGRPAWVTGRGENVAPLVSAALPPLWILLIFPGLAVSTTLVYRELDRIRESTGAQPVRKWGLAGLELFNDLEAAALQASPDLGRAFRRLQELGVPRLMVAGSGSTLCAAFDDPGEARMWADRTRAHGPWPAEVAAVRRRQAGPTPDV